MSLPFDPASRQASRSRYFTFESRGFSSPSRVRFPSPPLANLPILASLIAILKSLIIVAKVVLSLDPVLNDKPNALQYPDSRTSSSPFDLTLLSKLHSRRSLSGSAKRTELKSSRRSQFRCSTHLRWMHTENTELQRISENSTQEGNEQALYFDAHVLDAHRRRHDVRGCRCRFVVRYDHDQSEEIVSLKKICRRPETDRRLDLLVSSAAVGSTDAAKDPSKSSSSKDRNLISKRSRKHRKLIDVNVDEVMTIALPALSSINVSSAAIQIEKEAAPIEYSNNAAANDSDLMTVPISNLQDMKTEGC